MRRLVAALVAALLAVGLAGCGGGGGDDGGGAVVPPAGPAAAIASATPVKELPDRSAPESSTVFEAFPTGDMVPAALADRIEAGQPTLILFVDGSQRVTNEVRSAADKAVDEYSGVVDLLVFDLGRYASVDATGTAVVDAEGIQSDKTASQAVTLARELGVSGLPYVILTDDQSHIVFRNRGLVDADFLLLHMDRLTD